MLEVPETGLEPIMPDGGTKDWESLESCHPSPLKPQITMIKAREGRILGIIEHLWHAWCYPKLPYVFNQHNSPGKHILLWFHPTAWETEARTGIVTVCVSPSWGILHLISLMCYQYGNIGYLRVLAVWPSAFDESGPFPTRRKKEYLPG